jgi:hypothetical protein
MNSELAQAPASGRRRAEPARGRSGSAALPKLAVVLIALVGVGLVVAGGLQATVFAPSAVSQATLASPREPVVSTAVGLLGLDGPRVRVDVTDGGRRPVFIGIGRAADVDAYLARVSRLEVTGHDGEGTLLTRRIGAEASLPDPGSVDVWVTSVLATGRADLVWPDAPGQWRMVVATDGTDPAPDRIKLTWSGREVHTAAPALISVGLVLVVAGLIALFLLVSRSRWDGDS